MEINVEKIKSVLVLFFIVLFVSCNPKEVLESPDGKISVIYNPKEGFNVIYNGDSIVPITEISSIGLSLQDEEINSYRFVGASSIDYLKEDYEMVSGKRRFCSNEANQQVFHFENAEKLCLDIVFRVYNDGVAFRYNFPKLDKELYVSEENTTYKLIKGKKRWIQRLNPAYEDFYLEDTDGIGEHGERDWAFPALFEISKDVYALFTEANIMKGNSGSWLTNKKDPEFYNVHMAEMNLVTNSSWNSPWRIIIIGSLSDIVESTLVTDVCEPCALNDISWIKPGLVSWIYWANNHGSKDFQIVKKYIDFAVEMNLPYVLIDWEWDDMSNGGNLEDAVKYAISKNIKPLLWYNSSISLCPVGPLNRLNSKEAREKEFAWLNNIGVSGIKVDFFNQDSLSTMNYCLDILEDAAKFKLLINFHGATIPRGWQRTYPNLMTTEAVYGAEWYNNTPELTTKAAKHNCTLPFTRNVIGSMDYTPCAFTNSQHPHITSNAHELALLVVFESALQHLADRPEGFYMQPQEIRDIIATLPTVWDDTKLLNGYPSEYIVVARKTGDRWYVAGLNGTDTERVIPVDLTPIIGDKEFCIDIYCDGPNSDKFDIKKGLFQNIMSINCLPRGGFILVLNEK